MKSFLREINLLNALKIVKRSWWLVTPQTIQNCFKKSGIFKRSEEDQDLIECNEPEPELFNFGENFDGEENENCFGELDDTEILNEVRDGDDERIDLQIEDEQQKEQIPLPKPTRNEALRAFFILKRYLDGDDDIIHNIEDILVKKRKEDLIQTTMDDYLF
ncbi:tigger transposable element-derived protein 6-like [Eupeodes corollae]|uniref:tigger transposable element-derived protein 6-like n=1 Tax=Eupeodes corollae TaxID=290404 RepID=UPI002492331C|nr:tigger transposable element-derived protein 6-like [Eupeodes corollae]